MDELESPDPVKTEVFQDESSSVLTADSEIVAKIHLDGHELNKEENGSLELSEKEPNGNKSISDANNINELTAVKQSKIVEDGKTNVTRERENIAVGNNKKAFVKEYEKVEDCKRRKLELSENGSESSDDDSDVIYNLRRPRDLKPVIPLYPLIEPDDADAPSYICPDCDATFSTKKGVNNHIRIHIAEKFRKFCCSQCQREFDSNDDLVTHRKIHDNDRVDYSCKKCPVAFTDYYSYLRHTVSHMHRSVYRCLECQKPNKDKNTYLVHLDGHFEKRYHCHICNKKFATAVYRKHMQIHAEENGEVKVTVDRRTHTCGECGKVFKEKKGLGQHMSNHTGVKVIQCFYCGKGFVTKQQREVHMRIHTGERPYQCDTCDKAFRQSTDLNRHTIIAHTKERNFECEFCNKKFLLQSTLALHRKLHTHQNVYHCQECGQVCQSKQSLRTHLAHKHIKEEKFKCEICAIGFKTKQGLTRHYRCLSHKENLLSPFSVAL